jgi:ribosomal protein S18 acetylase RimI-like enzyme
MEIKVLSAGDATLLENAADDVFDDALQPALVAEFLRDPRHHLVVAVDAGRVVGFVSGVHYVHPDKPAEMFINEVGVAPSHHGRGIGKAVMNAFLEQASRIGCGQAWVLTERTNTPAMRLYASAGGEDAGDYVMFNFALNRPSESAPRPPSSS